MSGLQTTLKQLFNLAHRDGVPSSHTTLYLSLISEEYNEFLEATKKESSANQFKELCDLMWVIIQYANTRGWDLSRGMCALVDEYYSKFYTKTGDFQPLYREDGKLLKNSGFKKADFTGLV